MPTNNNLQKLHASLSKIDKGFTRTYHEFSADMQDEGKRAKLYQNLSKIDKGFTRSYNEFSSDMGFGYKVPMAYEQPVTTIKPDNNTGYFTPEIEAGSRGERKVRQQGTTPITEADKLRLGSFPASPMNLSLQDKPAGRFLPPALEVQPQIYNPKQSTDMGGLYSKEVENADTPNIRKEFIQAGESVNKGHGTQAEATEQSTDYLNNPQAQAEAQFDLINAAPTKYGVKNTDKVGNVSWDLMADNTEYMNSLFDQLPEQRQVEEWHKNPEKWNDRPFIKQFKTIADDQKSIFGDNWLGDASLAAGNVVERLNAGLSGVFAGSSELMHQWVEKPLYGWMAEPNSRMIWGNIADYFAADQEYSHSAGGTHNTIDENGQIRQKDFTDYYKEGDIWGMLGDLTLGGIESAPNSLAVAGTTALGMPQVGGAIVFTNVAGNKKRELDKYNPELSELQKTAISAGYGVVERYSEMLGDIPLGKMLAKIYKVGGSEAASHVIRNSVESIINQTTKNLKNASFLVKAPLTEYAEGIASNVGGDLIDAAAGLKDFDIRKTISDAATNSVYDLFAGGGFGLVGAPGLIRNAKVASKLQALKSEYDTANSNMQAAFSDSEFEFDGERIITLPVEQQKQILASALQAENLTPEQKTAIQQYMQAGNSLNAALVNVGLTNIELLRKKANAVKQIENQTNEKTGTVDKITIQGTADTENYTLKSGTVVFDETGKVNPQESDEAIYYYTGATNEDGTPEVNIITPESISAIQSADPKQLLQQSFMDIEAEEFTRSEFGEGMQVQLNTNVGKVPGTVVAVTPTGLVVNAQGQEMEIPFVQAVQDVEAVKQQQPQPAAKTTDFTTITTEELSSQYESINAALESGALNEQQTSEAVAAAEQIAAELEKRQQNPDNGQQVTYAPGTTAVVNGQTFVVAGQDEAGNYLINDQNGQALDRFTPAEMQEMGFVAAVNTDTQAEGDQSMAVNGGQSGQETIEAAPVQPKYPTNNKGELDFNQFTPEDHYQYAVETEGEAVAQQDLRNAIKDQFNIITKHKKKIDSASFEKKAPLRAQLKPMQEKLDVLNALSEKYIPQAQPKPVVKRTTAEGTASASIQERWENAPKAVGFEDTLTLPNGEVIYGRWVLSTAFAPTPSHNPETYQSSEGFPSTPDGKNVNDNDYSNKRAEVETKAADYDSRAIDDPIVVSGGVVVSGNNRTMSGQIAAKNGTDTKYVEALKTKAKKYGFTTEQVEATETPRIYFEVTDQLPLNVDTFAKFNARTSKSKSATEKAIVATKRNDADLTGKIMATIESFDSLADFYTSEKAQTEVLKYLLESGVINQNEVPELFENNNFTTNGRNYLEAVIIGNVMQEEQIKVLNLDGMKQYRAKIVRAIVPLLQNSKLAESMIPELNTAILYLYESGGNLMDYFSQQNMFSENNFDKDAVLLSIALQRTETNFKKFVADTNNALRDQTIDMFLGRTKTKDDVYEQFRETLTDTERATISNAERNGQPGTNPRSAENSSNASKPDTGGTAANGSDIGEKLTPAQLDTQSLDAEIAAQSHNNTPTDKQKETGIYDKARISLQGYNITLETLKGEQRSGTDSNGKAWSITMNNHYGELDGTTGYDGDAIDVFVGPNPKSGQIFVVDQVTPTPSNSPEGGEQERVFDESKVMLGFDTAEEAKAAYMSNYEAGWQGFGSITPAGDNFKTWLYDGKKQRKPFSEYKETPKAVKLTEQPLEKVEQLEAPKGITVIKEEDNGKTLIYGTKTSQTRLSVKGYTAQEIKEEISLEQQKQRNSITSLKTNEDLLTKTPIGTQYEAIKRTISDNKRLIENTKVTISWLEQKLKEASTDQLPDVGKMIEKPAEGTKTTQKWHKNNPPIDTWRNEFEAAVSENDIQSVYDIRSSIKIAKNSLEDNHQAQQGLSELLNTIENSDILKNYEERKAKRSAAQAEFLKNKGITPEDFKKLSQEQRNALSDEINKAYPELAEGYVKPETPKAELIPTPKHTFSNFKEAEEWAKKNIVGTYTNVNIGEDITVSKNAISKYLSGKSVHKSVDKDAHLSALIQIPRLIETSVLRESKPDRDNNPDIKEIQLLEGIINYEGENYPVKITVKAYQTGANKAYTYEVMEIESPVGNLSSHRTDTNPSTPDNQNSKTVSADKDNASNVENKINDVKNELPKYKNGDTVYYQGKKYVINGVYNGEQMYDLETEDGKTAFEEVAEIDLSYEAPADTQSIAEIATAVVEAEETVQIEKAEILDELTNGETEPIEDFGEKIGGARKDMGTTRTVREKDALPAWRRKYEYATPGNTIVLGEKVDTTKPFTAKYGIEGKNWRGQTTTIYKPVTEIKDGYRTYTDKVFLSEQEAEDYIPVFEVLRQGFKIHKGKEGYTIYKTASTGKIMEFDSFKTEEEAKSYLTSTEGATSLLNRKREDFSIPNLETVERTGADWRKGKDVSTEQFMTAFGFRGGEFGNWVKPEERRVLLNMAYDSFMDLADMLGISPKAISLGGNLSIAFGARGVKGAKAHYESNRAVINLTRLNGAGSLAHEWAHALDNYFGLQDAKKDYTRNEKGELIHSNEMLTQGKSYKAGMRKELAALFNKLVDYTTDKQVTRQMGLEDKQATFDKFQKATKRETEALLTMLEKGKQKRSYNRKTKQYEYNIVKATPEQLERAKQLTEAIVSGTTEAFQWQSLTANALGNYAYLNEEVRELETMFKSIFGHTGLKRDGLGFYNVAYYGNKLNEAKTQLDKAQSGETETLKVKTEYYINSTKFDAMRAAPYWATKVELFARSFEGYINTLLQNKNIKSDYLQYDKAPIYDKVFGMNPYPQGEELEAMNQMWKEFFDTVQEDDNGVIYQIIGEQGAKSLDLSEEATTRMDNLQVAREMEQANKTPEQIRLATGWERGVDGLWRYEVPDGKINEKHYAELLERKFNKDIKLGLINATSLGELYDSKELYNAYPELENMQVILYEDENQSVSASYNPNEKAIYIFNPLSLKSIESKDSTLIHEIQHAIQEIEGFAKGGNENTVDDRYFQLKEELKDIDYRKKQGMSIDSDYSRSKELQTEIKRLDDIEIINGGYKQLAGETEARNASARMNFTLEERRQTLLSATADVAPEDQIILFEGSGVSNHTGTTLTPTTPESVADTVAQLLTTGLAKEVRMVTPEEIEAMPDVNVQKQVSNKELKAKQFSIISKYNPAPNNYNTWIRTAEEIKTAEEAFSTAFEDGNMYPDFTVEDMKQAIQKGEVTIYSSKPIKQGNFVTPSLMNAEDYAGGGKVYSKTVKLTEVAWIDESEGQYAKVQFLRTPSGTIYGFVKNGVVYLNSSTPNLNTPIHEFGHLWIDAIEGSELYNRGAELVKNTPYWKRVNTDPNYKNLSETARIKEAMAMAIGDKGEAVKRDLGLFARIRTWINDVWKRIGAQFGIQNLTPAQIQNLTFNDFVEVAVSELMSGENLAERNKNTNFETSKNNNGSNEKTRLDNRRTMASEPERLPLGTITSSNAVRETIAGTTTTNARRSSSTSTQNAGGRWTKHEGLRQLAEQAKINGAWIENIKTLTNKKGAVNSGTENTVYLSPDEKRVIKSNNLLFLNENDTEFDYTRDLQYFFERITAHNILFPEDAYNIVGFTNDKSGNMSGFIRQYYGGVSIIMEQPLVSNATYPTQQEIDADLGKKGFIKTTLGKGLNEGREGYTNGIYELTDAKPQNVLKDKEGNMHYIDLDISKTIQPTTPDKPEYKGGDLGEYAFQVVQHNEEAAERATRVSKMQRLQQIMIEKRALATRHKNKEISNQEYAKQMVALHDERQRVLKGLQEPTPEDDGPEDNDPKPTRTPGQGVTEYAVALAGWNYRQTLAKALASTSSAVTSGLPPVDDDTPINNDMLRLELDQRLGGWFGRLAEGHQDNIRSVRIFLDLLREKGLRVSDYNNFYMQYTALQGKNDAHLKDFGKRFMTAINANVQNIQKFTNYAYRDLENYVFLKHGLERNEYMREAAKAQAEEEGKTFRERDDYSGIYAIAAELWAKQNGVSFNPKKKGEVEKIQADPEFVKVRDQIIADYIAEFEKTVNEAGIPGAVKGETLTIDGFWAAINAATHYSLDRLVSGGIESKKEVDDLKERYQYYVPLRGHEVEAEKVWQYEAPDNKNVVSKAIMQASGRSSRAEHPFAYIIQMAQTSINKANRNQLNQTLLRLARMDKSGLMSVSEAWYVLTGIDPDTGKEIWTETEPEYSEDHEMRASEVAEWNEKMVELEKEGKAKRFKKGLDIGGLFIKPKQRRQHAISILEDGITYQVYINGNPRVSQAINELNEIRLYIPIISELTRFKAAMITSRSPQFMLTNGARDFVFANTILPSKEGGKYTAKFLKNYPIAMATLANSVTFNFGDEKGQYEKYLKEFEMNGGETGYSHLMELQDIEKKLRKEQKGKNYLNPVTDVETLIEVIDAGNKVIENSTRLAVYITSRESGRSIERAVSDSKEVTLNFNRRGSGAMGASFIKAFYMFYNPAVQALANFGHVYKMNPVKMSATIGAYSAIGFMMPMIIAMIGGDDDEKEYMNMTDWERQTNLCLPTGGGFAKIPLPQEMRVFFKLGDEVYKLYSGRTEATETVMNTLKSAADMIPISPLGTIAVGEVNDFGDFMRTVGPDAFRDFAELSTNTNFMGGQIYDKYKAVKDDLPGYQKARLNRVGDPRAPESIYGFTKWLDHFTGGDNVKKGSRSWNPDVVNHLAKSYLGGMYSLIAEGGKSFTKRFYTSNADIEEKNTTVKDYYSRTREADELIRQEKGYYEEWQSGKITEADYNTAVNQSKVDKAYDIHSYSTAVTRIERLLKTGELTPDDELYYKNQSDSLKREVIKIKLK